MNLPLLIRILQNAGRSKLPPLLQEILRDLIDAYFSAVSNKDENEMKRISQLVSKIQGDSRKYVNSGPDDKTFVNTKAGNELAKGIITPTQWKKMRSIEHTGKNDGKTEFEIIEQDRYIDIVRKVKNRSDAYNPVNHVYYLNKWDGAKGFGHAAILLVNSEGNGNFYTYAAELSVNILVGLDVDAQLGKLYMMEDSIKDFLKTGKLAGIKDYGGRDYNGNGTDHYSGYIWMPVSNKRTSIEMYYKAEEIYVTPGKYNLFENNCNHTVQQILEKGGMDFTPTSGSSIDEQNTMVDLLVSNHKISSLIGQFVKDSLDCTLPNSAFIFGKLLAIGNEWEAGKLGK